MNTALRELLDAYLTEVESLGHAMPERPVERMTREGNTVTVTAVGQEPAPQLWLRDLVPDLLVPKEFAALQDAIGKALGKDAAHVDLPSAARAMVERHLREHGASVEERAVNESVGAFEAFAAHDEIIVRLVGLLENFESAEGTVQLADDVVLHAVNDEEREELWRQRGEQLLGLDPVTLGVVGTATHLLRVESRAERFGHDGNAVPLQTRSADALTALRLQRGGSVIARYQWFEALPPVADYSSAVRPWIPSGLLSGPWTGTRGQYVLDEIDVAQVPQVLAHLDALQPPERTLALALRRFDLTYARGPVEDRIIDVWIALEALFAPDQSSEIRYRASSRIGRFLGQTPEERVDIQRFLRLSYDVRSHLVHGGDPDRFAKRTQPKVDAAGGLNGVADRTEDTLRRSLRQWIAAPRAPTAVVADIDDQMMA